MSDEFDEWMKKLNDIGLEGYILDAEHRPVKTDFVTAAIWWGEGANRQIAHDVTARYRISTICLPIDHRHFCTQKRPPLLFETMVFTLDGAVVDDGTCRYSSWDDAVAGHAAMLRRFKFKSAREVAKSVTRQS